MRLLGLLLLLLFLLPDFIMAGDDRETALQIQYGSGFLFAHTEELNYLDAGRFRTIGVSYEWRKRGEEPWHSYFAYPSSGVFASYTTFGNRETLGYLLTAGPFVRFPLFFQKGATGLQLKLAGGASWLEKPFHPQNNSRNLAIGTHLNVYFKAKLAVSYQIAEKWELNTGLSFNHFSNGSFQKPNKGINYAQLELGLLRIFNPKERVPTLEPLAQKTNFTSVMLSASMRSPNLRSNSQFGVLTIHAAYNHWISKKFYLMGGADLVYNAGNRRESEIRNLNPDAKWINYQFGLFGGIAMNYGPSTIFLNKGYFVFSENISTAGFYHRLGYRRSLSNRYFVHAGIFSNYFQANFLDLGIGIKFR